jgi:hypothetical protein
LSILTETIVQHNFVCSFLPRHCSINTVGGIVISFDTWRVPALVQNRFVDKSRRWGIGKGRVSRLWPNLRLRIPAPRSAKTGSPDFHELSATSLSSV